MAQSTLLFVGIIEKGKWCTRDPTTAWMERYTDIARGESNQGRIRAARWPTHGFIATALCSVQVLRLPC